MKSSCRVTQTGTDQKSLRIHTTYLQDQQALPCLCCSSLSRQGWADRHYRIPKFQVGSSQPPVQQRGLLHRHPLHFILREESVSFITGAQPAEAQPGNCSVPQQTHTETIPHWSCWSVCFSLRWIIFCPLGLIPKSFSRKDSHQLSSVNCLITSYPTDGNSTRGWSPLHCAPEHHIVPTNLHLCSHLQVSHFNVCWSLAHLCP